MSYFLNEEVLALQREVRKFAAKELAPRAAELDRTGEFPRENVAKLGDLGLLGMVVGEEYGGADFGSVALAVAIEEVSYACSSTGVIMSVNNSLTGLPVYLYGNDYLKDTYLERLATGEIIGAFALTEPGAGSDAASISTTAVRDGDEYVLNGTKRFITNAEVAQIFLVFAVTDKEKRAKGITAFIVDRDTPGFEVGKHEDMMGVRATGTCELSFEDCRVPVEHVLGELDQGFILGMKLLDYSRIGIGAQSVGIAQRALDLAVQYSKERKQFGKAICEFEMVQDMLATCAAKVAAARHLVLHAAYLKDEGTKKITREAAIAKYYASEIASDVTRACLQIHGGYGYSKEYDIERLYRDAKVLEIYEGTTQIQKIVIARSLLEE
jgi:alkylation response protein AidB-like acyl-CoA dehydrogenase